MSAHVPVYQWRLESDGTLCVTGPLHRDPARRRFRRLRWAGLPMPLRETLRAASGDASQTPGVAQTVDPMAHTLVLDHRVVTCLHTGEGCGLLMSHTRMHHRVGALSRFLHELESSLDALPEAFVLFDQEDRLILANEQYFRIYRSAGVMAQRGVPFTEIASRSVRMGEFLIDEDPQDWLRRRVAFHRNGEGFFEQHLDDGRWIRLSERRTRSGGIVSVRADITALKERERTLQRMARQAEFTSQSMARFLAVFSHEMRNGLNGIMGIAQILALEHLSTTGSGHTQQMLDSCTRMSTVMTDLLDYLRHQASGVTVVLRDTDPGQPIRQVCTELDLRARSAGVSLRCMGLDQAWRAVRADAARVAQVLANLVSNAIKYGGPGRVDVSVRWRAGRLRYAVSDQGPGIAPEQARTLFDFFDQASSDTPDSSGLGLAISRQLVQAMGGTIRVRSRLGKGTVFWFEVAAELAQGAVELERSTRYTASVAGLRVCILDDDPLNGFVAEDFLLRLGHVPQVLGSGDDAVKAALEGQMEVLLLDLDMPGESGFEVARRVRAALGPRARLGIIAVTGRQVAPDVLARCEAAGMDLWIEKPVHLAELGRLLHKVVQRLSEPAQPVADDPGRESAGSVAVATGNRFASATLSQLRHDLSNAHFLLLCESAMSSLRHFSTCLESGLTERWGSQLHRVYGSMAQLGFASLADAARAAEVLLQAQQGLATTFTGDYDIEAARMALAQQARDALGVLQAQRQTVAGEAHSRR